MKKTSFVFLLHIFLLSGCFANRALNYPFREQEFIASFPIDANSTEVQIFELDGVRTDKIFYNKSPSMFRTEMPDKPGKQDKGPYTVFLCIDDAIDDEYNGVKVIVSLKSEQFWEQRDTSRLKDWSWESRKYCSRLRSNEWKPSGWQISFFWWPGDFDIDQKVTLSFQIIEDPKKYLAGATNHRLILSAGREPHSK